MIKSIDIGSNIDNKGDIDKEVGVDDVRFVTRSRFPNHFGMFVILIFLNCNHSLYFRHAFAQAIGKKSKKEISSKIWNRLQEQNISAAADEDEPPKTKCKRYVGARQSEC